MRYRFIRFARHRLQSGKTANHPITVVQFPVKRRAPFFPVDRFPALGKPPAKILIAVILYELEKIAVAHRRPIKGVILEEDLMRGLLVIESEVVKTLDFGLWILDFVPEAQPKESAFNFSHALNRYCRGRRRLNGRVELIAKQMLDVVNQQLLVLHLVLKSQSHQRNNRRSI